ncbi:hypothetical protein D9758_016636 [Tetrapyrgos nigripes]|uniref:SWIM-type domain-containing protein n=1 Tax=Tetrapyrgos nigripes TaxID=182062 RepID=A0A8H5C0I2_9AGAR|nr:hypothetical protein D9758_016636 [Tetrapyrgos nigripes]
MDLFSSPSKVKIEYIYFHLRQKDFIAICNVFVASSLSPNSIITALRLASLKHTANSEPFTIFVQGMTQGSVALVNLPGDAKINGNSRMWQYIFTLPSYDVFINLKNQAQMAKTVRSSNIYYKSSHKSSTESQASVPSHKVTERPDGTFQCSCMKWTQSGKTCKHILAVIMQERFVSVEEYHKLETICAKCGKQAAGIFSNPKKVEKGQHSQARTDATVQSELDAVLQMFEKKGCGNPFAQEDWCMKGITNTGACTSSDAKPDENSGFNLNASLCGQPAEVQPLHLGHSKNAQNPQKNTQKKDTKLVFNGKKGPKAKQKIHPNSLLMAGPEQIH